MNKYGYRLDSLHHLFHSLIIPVFTYGISVWDVACYDKCLSQIDKFQKRAVRFGFLKEVSPVLSLLEASDNRLWKSKTTSTDSPLVHLLPPSKTSLLRNRGHSYVLPQIRTERFKRSFINRCLFNFIQLFIVIQNVCFLQLIKSLFFYFLFFIYHEGSRNYSHTSLALLKRYRVIHPSKNSFLNVFSLCVVFFKHQLNKSNAKLFNSYTKK